MPSQRPHSRQSSDSHIGNRKKLKNLTVQLGQRHKIFRTKTKTKMKFWNKNNKKLQLKSNALVLRSRRFGLPKFLHKETRWNNERKTYSSSRQGNAEESCGGEKDGVKIAIATNWEVGDGKFGVGRKWPQDPKTYFLFFKTNLKTFWMLKIFRDPPIPILNLDLLSTFMNLNRH